MDVASLFERYEKVDKELGLNWENFDSNYKHCVFISFYCMDGSPYYRYANTGIKVPLVLAVMRHDGTMGFIGGKVDKEDGNQSLDMRSVLLTALARECNEETDCYLSKDKSMIEHLVTHADHKAKYYIHHFTQEMPVDTLIGMPELINNDLAMTELTGTNVIHIANYMKNGKFKGGYMNTLNQSFAGSGKLELIELVARKKMLTMTRGTIQLEMGK